MNLEKSFVDLSLVIELVRDGDSPRVLSCTFRLESRRYFGQAPSSVKRLLRPRQGH